MKAVIMAGGEGTRLRPVSLGLPKPMVRLFDRPALGFILDLLRESGVTEACLTLKYMPGAIIDYIGGEDFGIILQTKTENIALGTAGSVKNCSDFIKDDDFLVISGDCICDFDLKSLMEFHKAKGAEATLALYEHPEPLEYGLVVTDSNGRIKKFVEKPTWENVVTNQINTGIYVLSPSVLRDIPSDGPYDFGKDLFPALLAKNRALYAFPMKGYWCDIGSPGAYLKCCADILDGVTRIHTGAEQISGGIFSLSPVPPCAEITPPVYIGGNVRIKPGAKIGPRAVIGAGSYIACGAAVGESVINGAAVLEGASVSGAIICGGALIAQGASVREEAVVGDGCIIGENAVISHAVRLWPDRKIEPGTLISDDLTRGMLKRGLSFLSRSVISGDIGVSLTPDAVLKLGMSAGSAAKRVGLCSAGGAAATVLAETIGCGVRAAGGKLVHIDTGLPSCASFAASTLLLPLTICVNQDGDKAVITFFGENGSLLPRDMERKLLSAPEQSFGSGYGAEGYRDCEYITGISELYTAAAVRYAKSGGVECSVTGGGEQNRMLRRALTLLGCTVVTGEKKGVPCFEARNGGMELYLTGEDGRQLTAEQTLVLAALIEFSSRGRSVIAVPLDAPEALDTLADRFSAKVLRVGRDGAKADKLYAGLPSLRDAVFMGALICGHMREQNSALSELTGKIPDFSRVTRELPLRRRRCDVMAALSEAAGTGAEFSGGIGMRVAGGFVRVSPLRGENALRIRSEGAGAEIAEELCTDVIRRLREIDREQ